MKRGQQTRARNPAAVVGMPERRLLAVAPLTQEAFAPFGDVIEATGAPDRIINAGFAHRFHDRARIDVVEGGGRPAVSVFHAFRRPFPLIVDMLERHPMASQAFYPLSNDPWLIVVAVGSPAPDLGTLACFLAHGRQGVNYARNVWHFPVLTLKPEQHFLVIDREGPGSNLEEQPIAEFEIDFSLSS